MLPALRSPLQRAVVLFFLNGLWTAACCLAANDSSWLLVDDFDGGIQNRLSGYRNTFERAPSSARALRTSDVFHGAHGKSLRLAADRQPTGYCGQWIHFFDMRARRPRYLDVRQYSHLSFWIKGERGGERLSVHLADRQWIAKEDSVLLGNVADFLPGGVATTWQEVLVPLERVSKLDLEELAAVTFAFTSPGRAVVHIDDIAFQRAPVLDTRLSQSPLAAISPACPPQPRAMWVWTSGEILADESKIQELLACCAEQHIHELWMQLNYRLQRTTTTTHAGSIECGIAQVRAWRAFLQRAHAAGVVVHALDGAPEYALKEQHFISLSFVDSIINFNACGKPAERFDGIHFDNEPYLLLGWSDPLLRERILAEFLALNAECQRRVTASRDGEIGLQFGIDIPFWWQERETPEGPCLGDVTYQGKRQPASYHCLEMLDIVGIMNYRDTADGADGMIYHGRDLLAHATSNGRAKVYMGVETLALEPTRVRFAVGLPQAQFCAAVRGRGASLAFQTRLQGRRLHRFDDGQNMHVGIEVKPRATALEKQAEEEALREIAETFGVNAEPALSGLLGRIEDQAESAIRKNPEWREFERMTVAQSSQSLRIHCFEATSVTPRKVTFAEESLDEFRIQTAFAEQEFSRTRPFAGIAIHAYESFRAKSATRPEGQNGQSGNGAAHRFPDF